jgi:hypothetical protein
VGGILQKINKKHILLPILDGGKSTAVNGSTGLVGFFGWRSGGGGILSWPGYAGSLSTAPLHRHFRGPPASGPCMCVHHTETKTLKLCMQTQTDNNTSLHVSLLTWAKTQIYALPVPMTYNGYIYIKQILHLRSNLS